VVTIVAGIVATVLAVLLVIHQREPVPDREADQPLRKNTGPPPHARARPRT
jgi:hypothetical protein